MHTLWNVNYLIEYNWKYDDYLSLSRKDMNFELHNSLLFSVCCSKFSVGIQV